MAEKPTFILKGRIVTMQSENNIIDDGLMVIKNGHIVKIVTAIDQLPEEFAGNKIIETHGSIYPGMIDLHNHFVYNVLPLWVVPKRYENRSQWPAHEQYKSDVSKPIRLALAKYSVSAKALVRFVEAKALISGTTTGQGMRTKVKGGSKLFQGTMRFVEEPGTTALLPARSMVPNLITTGSTAKERIDSFRSALNDPDSGAYFYHLSEGRDESSRNHFLNLQQYDLINNKLVGIHSLGLRQEDLSHLATIGAKVVWSPFSNQLLYGQTIDLNILKNSGVIFSIGCDWSPSGSKNLLQELKVAYHINEVQGNVFTPFELVAAVTSNAAAVTGWQHHLGTLEEGKLADIIVVKGHQSNPYAHLINTTEKDIELVIIDGIARYGNTLLMNALRVDHSRSLEEINIGNEKKSLYLFNQNSPLMMSLFKHQWKP